MQYNQFAVKIQKQIINSLSPVRFKNVEDIQKIVSRIRPVYMYQAEFDDSVKNHLFLLLRNGKVVKKDNKIGQPVYRRATPFEVANHESRLNSTVAALRGALSTRFQFQATLMKNAQISNKADFNMALQIIRNDTELTSDTCRSYRGDKYRYLTETEIQQIRPARKQYEKLNNADTKDAIRAEENSRWAEKARQDALKIGLTRFEKFQELYPVTFNWKTGKWGYSPTGFGDFDFDIEVGRKIYINFGDIELVLTSLYRFIPMLEVVKKYRTVKKLLESTCDTAIRAPKCVRTSYDTFKGGSTFQLKLKKTGSSFTLDLESS